MDSPCDSVQIKYIGDGSTILFTFPFDYLNKQDIIVELWNDNTDRWEPIQPWYTGDAQPAGISRYYWRDENDSTIRTLQIPEAQLGQFNPIPNPVDWAPPAPSADTTESSGANLRIRRATDVDPLKATFYPGSSIRAKDLNDNFKQLKLAIEEGRCSVEDIYDYLDGFYIDRTDLVTREEQINGSPRITDTEVFTTSASAARHDTYHQDSTPASVPVEQPGKQWFDTSTLDNYIWDANAGAWVDMGNAGPAGPQGDFGPPGRVIVGDNPPTEYPAVGDNEARPLESGDLWYNSILARLYIWYVDNTGGQWVSVSITGPQGPEGPEGPQGADGGIPEAPLDGVIYGRQNGDWVTAGSALQFTEPLVNLNDTVSIDLQLLNATP